MGPLVLLPLRITHTQWPTQWHTHTHTHKGDEEELGRGSKWKNCDLPTDFPIQIPEENTI